MVRTAVIVERKPGEYNSLEATLELVSNMGAACLVNRLFSTSNPNFIGSYAVTILGLCRAERYYTAALAQERVLQGRSSVNFGKVLIKDGSCHWETNDPPSTFICCLQGAKSTVMCSIM
jgi:hypothetical protein